MSDPASSFARGVQAALHGASHAAATSSGSSAESLDRGLIRQIFLDVFGTSKAQAHTAQLYLAGPVRIAIVLLVALVLTRLIARVSNRLVGGLRLVSPLVRATPRGAERVHTIAAVFTSVARAVIWVVALLTILGELNINLVPFVATATVIGAALGFGAQSLVKDFLSGILILAEDQYGIGDHIVVGTGANTTSGTVESLNLRVTRLRGADGVVYYVPNGDIRVIGNDTEADSQALVDVVVPLGTDLARAGTVAVGAARAMATEADWREVIAGEPTFAGVQAATEAGVTLRVTALTRPGQHYRTAREMRLRVLEGLRREGVAWAPAAEQA